MFRRQGVNIVPFHLDSHETLTAQLHCILYTRSMTRQRFIYHSLCLLQYNYNYSKHYGTITIEGGSFSCAFLIAAYFNTSNDQLHNK